MHALDNVIEDDDNDDVDCYGKDNDDCDNNITTNDKCIIMQSYE